MVIVKNNFFSSKADVLKFLQKKLKKSKIEMIFDFTVSDWSKKEEKILQDIETVFDSNNLIVRSSAIGEDSLEKSQAGNYQSILNVPSNSKRKLKNAINLVIQSYRFKGNYNSKNQILIQTLAEDVVTSGVVLTRTEDRASPYYVVNYVDGSSTDRVTRGDKSNTIKFFKKIQLSKLSKRWKSLVIAIQEIESILKTDSLDVEFGITNSNKVLIFQVRPITFLKKTANLNKEISNVITQNKRKFLKLNKPTKFPGDHTIFSDMADWNPAEIIGNNPSLLDYSLYDYLILQSEWREGRSRIGYQDVKPLGLMVRFGNKPYIDTRASFNSLIPETINKKLKKKLLKFYLAKLEKNPHLHDKVEFDILYSCYDPSLEDRLKELLDNGFTKSEISEIKSLLIDFTNKIVAEFPTIRDEATYLSKKMESNRKKILLQLKGKKLTHRELLDAAKNLLKDCKNFGVLPFSAMARVAFIGSILLKSLVKKRHISPLDYESFMNTVNTPVYDLQQDYIKYCNKQLSKSQFFKKYGHLRSGTYDITAQRYDKKNPFLENIKFLKTKRKTKKFKENKKVNKILKKHSIKFNGIDFFSFVRDSLSKREYLKFEFTRNLSDTLEFIAEAGQSMGFSRSDISNLDIKTILTTYNKFDKKTLKTIWKKKIANQKKSYLINSNLHLPPLIFSVRDFDIIKYYIAKPNFITSEKIIGEIAILKDPSKIPNLENKIVIIENADPGYDWIFTKNLGGIITRYGGVASHMAIRCAEMSLPAAIGCGTVLYEKLTGSSKVLLDCENHQIIILKHRNRDEFLEEKRALKSLGYIK